MAKYAARSAQLADDIEVLMDFPEGSVMLDGSGDDARISLSNAQTAEIVEALRTWVRTA